MRALRFVVECSKLHRIVACRTMICELMPRATLDGMRGWMLHCLLHGDRTCQTTLCRARLCASQSGTCISGLASLPHLTSSTGTPDVSMHSTSRRTKPPPPQLTEQALHGEDAHA